MADATGTPEGAAPVELSRRERRARRAGAGPTRGRTASVVAVVAVVAVIAAVDAVAGTPPAPPAPPVLGATAVPPADAASSSWFCAGGGVGPGSVASPTVSLSNTTDRPVAGVMTVTVDRGSSGSVTLPRRSVDVPAGGTSLVDPGTGAPAGSVATTFTFATGGVGVSQVLSGPSGWTTSPCASSTSSQWYLAAGSTAAGATQTLSLYNPTSTDAAVNVTFLTGGGVVQPQDYQGLVVPAGQLVVENVGDFVQDQGTIATEVQAQAGQVVAFQLQQWQAPPAVGIAVLLGSPVTGSDWQFPQTTETGGSAVTLHLANPGPVADTATIDVEVSAISVQPVVVPVPPNGVADVVVSGEPSFPRGAPYAIGVSGSTGTLVVARTVQAGPQAAPPQWGASMGTPFAATGWLVPAPGVPGDPAVARAAVSSLAVANPGDQTTRVTVAALAGGRAVTTLSVPPRSLAVLSGPGISGLHTLIVRASQPVAVEEDAVPSGAPGVVSSPGLPLATG